METFKKFVPCLPFNFDIYSFQILMSHYLVCWIETCGSATVGCCLLFYGHFEYPNQLLGRDFRRKV